MAVLDLSFEGAKRRSPFARAMGVARDAAAWLPHRPAPDLRGARTRSATTN